MIASMFLTSCEEWLTISSDTEFANEDQFKNQQGFQDAVIGVYLNLSETSLYGKNLTWGYLEYLAQNYELVANSTFQEYFKYEYTTNNVSSTINGIWGAAYNTIANINNILKWEKENREVLHVTVDSLIKGELLGIRALLHFDLMRMHGKGSLAMRPEVLKELSVPYATEYRKEKPTRYSYGETLEFIINDLRQAAEYLKMDPMIGERETDYYETVSFGGFVTDNRNSRMNYYAVKVLLARVLMWRGTEEDKQEAYMLASEVYTFANEKRTFSLAYETSVSNPSWFARETDMRREWIFAPLLVGLRDIIGNSFSASSVSNETLYWTKESVDERFEIPDLQEDFRYTNCLRREGPDMENFSILKNRKPDASMENQSYREQLSVIRLPEVYYIMAECLLTSTKLYDRERAVELLNEIRVVRSIPKSKNLDATTLTDEGIMKEILKEYRKEFVGEGVQFYCYKRLGIENIPGREGAMSDLQYVIPWPLSEEIFSK